MTRASSAWTGQRVLVTGARGTIGAPLSARLHAEGATVVAWDRSVADPLDPDAIDRYVHDVAPDRIVHLAVASQSRGVVDEGRRINLDWPRRLATLAADRGVPFGFTSTAMVFSNEARGPFTLMSVPDAAGGYGFEKRIAEVDVARIHPACVIVRLGWQIGAGPDGNQMIGHFHRRANEDGRIVASTRWLPACSFLDDTVEALVRLFVGEPGLFMIDGNAGWSFFDVARALRAHCGADWPIDATDDFVYDQRLIDPRVQVPSIASRLPVLQAIAPEAI